jgi:hypothetical protein
MPVFRTVQDAQSGEIRLEALHQPLYDAQTITTTTDYSYFQNPAGRSALLTNVPTAGQLSWPKRFSIKAIRLVPNFGTILADLVSFYANSVFRLKVGEKDYLQIPAFMLTPGVGLETQNTWDAQICCATNAGTVYANNGRPDHHNIYGLIHPVYVPPVQNFSVTVTPLAGATFTTAGFRLWCFLEGELLREIQ